MKYTVTIIATVEQTIEVDADDELDAECKAWDQFDAARADCLNAETNVEEQT